ncbi:hypothetical protein FGLOB1_166 [Fusarium globosum]|uniref:Uncharacterized protein n=1 Tax=Fusarium globosum TaxID=78864 RepID=A0A8H5Z1T9_9HYPO|nr:hypothetical protein FGLOB1_166 [Fusarium globosum]
MFKPLESDPPLIDKGDPERLSPAALRLAHDQPDEFVLYLRRVWDTNRRKVLDSAKLLHQLRQVKVSCRDQCLHPLSEAWVPTENLISIWSLLLLPEERFRFLILKDQKLNHADRSSWNFLREIGCQYEAGDQFLTDLLLTIKKTWPTNVKDPGHVLGIYAYFLRRLNRTQPYPDGTYYKLLSDDKLWDNFNACELLLYKGEWIKPSSCFLRAPDYVRSKRVLTPAAGTDATSLEPLAIRHFYQLVLCIPNFPDTWAAIIDELRGFQRSTGQTSIQQVTELYRALNEIQLSEPERVTIRKRFLQHSLIAIEQGSVIAWQTHLTCIWSPLNKIRNLAELSRPYPYLKDFFVGLLKVEEATEKTVLSRMSYWTPEFEIRDLFSLLNGIIATSNISMKPDKLLTQRIFLGKWNGEKYRFVGSTEEFFIPDDEEFANTFKEKLPLLDITAEEIALLDPLFTWLAAQKQKIEWDIAQRAEGILRIALHCGSPRTTTDVDSGTLLNILKKGEMLAVEGMQSEKVVLTRQKGSKCLGTWPNHKHGLTAPSTHPKLAIAVDEAGNALDRLILHVSSDKEERDLALFTSLPRCLMKWLMADPKTQAWGTATLLGVSLLKSVLTAPPNVIDAILTREGVGRVRFIEANLTTIRQEVAPQNTTSNGPADQPSQSRYDCNPYSNEVEAHRNRSEDASPATTPTTLAKQPVTPVRSSQQPQSAAGPSSARGSQETTPQAEQLQSTSGRHAEPSSSEIKTPSKDESSPSGNEGVYKPRYASISQRPKLKPRSRKRLGSPSSSPPATSPSSQIPDDVIRGIERLRIADTSEVTLQSPKLIPVA